MLQEYCRGHDGCFTHIWDDLDEQEKKLHRQLLWDEFEDIDDFLE